jgi:hypothetical protein
MHRTTLPDRLEVVGILESYLWQRKISGSYTLVVSNEKTGRKRRGRNLTGKI